MSSTTFKYQPNSIVWAKDQGEVSQNDTGMIEVRVEGMVQARNVSLEDALRLIPNTLPTGPDGPAGLSPALSAARLATRGARYDGAAAIVVNATYRISGAGTTQFPGGQDRSDYDRAERRISVFEAPILTHPCAMDFPTKEKNKLANLLRGNITPGMPPDDDPDGDPEFEFVREVLKPDGTTQKVEVKFSTDKVTVDGISLSPYDVANMIRADVNTYLQKSVRHTWRTSRNSSASNNDYRAVGTVVSNPPKAPSLASGFQWMMTGITDVSQNDNSWSTDYEFEASGPGGFLTIYKGGSAQP